MGVSKGYLPFKIFRSWLSTDIKISSNLQSHIGFLSLWWWGVTPGCSLIYTCTDSKFNEYHDFLWNLSRFSQLFSDSELWKMLPNGTRSVLVQPVKQSGNKMEKIGGFILLASSLSYAFSDKDRAWIRALANKFIDRDILWNSWGTK